MGKKDARYFSHDSNARNDPKMIAMRQVYGIKGYGMYWVIIENLRDQSDYKLEMKNYIYIALSVQAGCEPEHTKQFINDCIVEFELFNCDDNSFWSNSLLRRMEMKDYKSQQSREAANIRWSNTNQTQQNKGSDMPEVKEPPKKEEGEYKSNTDIRDHMLLPEIQRQFDMVCKAYPRKDDLKKAFYEFKSRVVIEGKVNTNICSQIVNSIKEHTKSENWTKDEGKYIPLLSKYLKDDRWRDMGIVKPKKYTYVNKKAYENFINEPENKKLINEGKIIVEYKPNHTPNLGEP